MQRSSADDEAARHAPSKWQHADASADYRGPERRARHGWDGDERRAGASAPRGMESRARFLGHPLHQQLVVFPLGLLATAVVFDVVHLLGGGPTAATVSFWMIVSGLVGGLAASPFGLIDWLAIPSGTRAKAVGAAHGAGNFAVLLLFLLSALVRVNDAEAPGGLALGLSFAGGALALVTAWLGGELVNRLGIGVSPQAGPNAPNSLRSRAG